LTWVIDKVVIIVEKLVSLGRSAIAAVKRWLGLEKRFEANDGQSHRLYMSGSEDNPVLMVATNPMAFTMFLSSVMVEASDTKKADAKNNAVVVAGQIDARKSTTLPGETKEEKIAAVQLLLDKLATYTKELFGDPAEAGEPEVGWPEQHGSYGKKMTSVKLNKKQKLKGSGPTSAANASYSILNQRRDEGNPNESYYVKGHLLNESIGGLGGWNNLTPLSRPGNSAHEGQVESLVKAAFHSGAVVEYNVTAEYGWGTNAGVIPATDPDAAVKKAIIDEEKNVPRRLKCEAYVMEKTGVQFLKQTDKKVVVGEVDNIIGQTAESYAVSGSSATRSFAELETEVKAMFTAPSPDTWAVFQNKDAVHRNSIALLTPVEKSNLEKLFIDHFRLTDKNVELGRITAMGAAADIQTWTAFKGGRSFYAIADALSTEVEAAFDAKQSALRDAAFASATAAVPTVAAGMLWRDFKIANNINFQITTAGDQAKLEAVQEAFEAREDSLV
jgi:hypothetical protein